MDNSCETHQTIVAMSDYQPHSGYASLSLVEAYWEALRAGREMPKRAEIDPRGIESALAHAFILERVAPGVARMRIAGSHLNDVIGIEARGMPITSLFEHDARIRVAGLLEDVFQTPATAEIFMHATGSLGQPELSARMILLPLKSDLGDVSRILGCFVSLGEVGDVPRRFDIQDATLRRLDGVHTQTPVHAQKRTAGFAEPTAPFAERDQTDADAVQGTPKRRPPYLRLIRTDD